MGNILTELSASPILAFTVLLLVTLTIPPIFERLRLPGLVGLIVAGVFLGGNGLQVLSADDEAMKLLTDIGKIYLMFVAGLEIDLEQFRQTRNRSLTFGVATFLVPLITGITIGQIFGYGINTSVLIGSLLASHTLLGYPIVQRLGVVKNEAVTVTIGATIFTDIAALLVLAICISIHAGEFSTTSLIIQLSVLAIYAVVVLFGFDWAGKEYFRRTGDEESNQFLFVLLAVFLASVGAEAINVDKIVGAFLAGLAINDVVGRGPVEEKIEFVGSTLFIPFFFVGTGLLLDVPAFIENLTTNLGLTLSIVAGLIGSKLLAAIATKGIFRYSWNETLTMWSLSMPQVAATLAAALAALQVGLINDAVFNTVIVLMLVTSLVGPLVTERFAPKLEQPQAPIESSRQQKWLTVDGEMEADEEPDSSSGVQPVSTLPRLKPFTIVVPVYNPLTERYLIEMAALMASYTSGMAIPLAIVKANVHMDEPQLVDDLKHGHRLLDKAIAQGEEFGLAMSPEIRIDDDVAEGISRTAREKSADLIVMGWSETTGIRARLFGNVIDSVFWSAHCPVAVTRLLEAPVNIHRILVPLKSITPQSIRTVRFAQLFASANQAEVTLLHVCDRRTPIEQYVEFETALASVLQQDGPKVNAEIKTLCGESAAAVILEAAQDCDLVVLRSVRRRTAGGLAVSDVTTAAIRELKCSVVLFGEPHT